MLRCNASANAALHLNNYTIWLLPLLPDINISVICFHGYLSATSIYISLLPLIDNNFILPGIIKETKQRFFITLEKQAKRIKVSVFHLEHQALSLSVSKSCSGVFMRVNLRFREWLQRFPKLL